MFKIFQSITNFSKKFGFPIVLVGVCALIFRFGLPPTPPPAAPPAGFPRVAPGPRFMPVNGSIPEGR